MKNILSILFIFWSFNLSAINYYIKNGGDNGKDGKSDTNAWATISKMEGYTFSPGDTVFLNRGDEWTENMLLTNSKHSGIVITNYGVGDLPKFNGYNKHTGWTNYSGNIWYITNAIRIWDLLLFNGSWAEDRVNNIAELDTNHEFFDDVIWPFGGSDDTLFVYLTNVSDTFNIVGSIFFNPTIEATTIHDVVFDGLAVEYGQNAISITNSCNNITVKNCSVSWSGGNNMYFQETHNLFLYNNTISNCGGDGLYVLESDTVEVSYNTITNAGQLDYINSDCQSSGFWYVSHLNYHHNTINHTGLGAVLESSSTKGTYNQEDNNIYNNIIYNSSNNHTTFSVFAGDFDIYNNIVIHAAGTSNVGITGSPQYIGSPTYLRFYHNTVIGASTGNYVVTMNGNLDSPGEELAIIKNNIFYNCWRYYNVRSYFLDNITSDYNIFLEDGRDKFYSEGNTWTLSEWRTVSGEDVNSIIADPLFILDGSADSLALSSASLAIDVGTDVSILKDYLGNNRDASPDIGAYEYITPDVTVVPTLSYIATQRPYWVTATTATTGGFISDDGGADVAARGVCWNTTGTPDTGDSKTTDGTGDGAFISTMTGLTQGVTYYVRAYATNEAGTAYGSQMTFRTQIIKHLNKVIKHLGKFMIVN